MTIDTPAGWIHESKADLPAPAERVFAALTDPAELREWFAEQAEVQLQVGGRYQFWGKHSYQVPTHREATQVITQLNVPTLLGFSWRIDDGESDVTLQLESTSAGQCRLRVRHAFAKPQDHEVIEDLWRMTLGNLGAYLTGGGGIVLPDFAENAPTIELSIVIEVLPAQLFRALVEPASLDQWLAPANATVDARVGGHYSYGWQYTVEGRSVAGGPTTILQLVADQRLVTDWPDWRGHLDRPKTEVAWILERVEGGTRLTLIHSGFARPTDLCDYGCGWWFFLGRLKHHLETRNSATAGT